MLPSSPNFHAMSAVLTSRMERPLWAFLGDLQADHSFLLSLPRSLCVFLVSEGFLPTAPFGDVSMCFVGRGGRVDELP